MRTIEPQNTQNLKTDLTPGGWIDLFFPASLRPYAYLMRLDRPIGTWLLLLPGWWSIALSYPLVQDMERMIGLFILFALGAIIMRGAGCVINDLWDRDFDRQVERTRTRPLAAGTVSVKNAFLLTLFLFFFGFLILLHMNRSTVVLGFISIPFIIIYPFMKRITWWPQAFLGLTFNFGALMGWTAMTGELGIPALLLYISGFFWTLGYDTIYAHMDTSDDSLIGVKSTARLFGHKNSRKMIAFFYVLSSVFLFLSLAFSFPFWIIPFLIIGPVLSSLYQILRFNPLDTALCLKLFKYNRDQGMITLIAIFCGVVLTSNQFFDFLQ